MNLLSKVLKFSKKYLSLALGILAFLYVGKTVWSYLSTIQASEQEIQVSGHIFPLLMLSLLFYLLNWLSEAYKWKIALKPTFQMSVGMAFKSIFKGITYGIATPNRIGEFAGRVTVLPFELRKYAIGKHMILSVSQSVVTVTWGLVALFFSPYLQLDLLKAISSFLYTNPMVSLAIFMLSILSFSFWTKSKWFDKQILTRIKKIIPSVKEFLIYLSISQFRYLAFLAQYMTLLAIFDIPFSFLLMWHISLMLLLITYVPSTFLTQLGIRGSIALFCLSPFGISPLVILLVTSILWLINAAVPALLGISIKGQLFRKTQLA